MAKFNPAEAIPEDTQTRQVKFNPDEAIPENTASSKYPNWLRKSDDFINKSADLVNDAGKGTDAAIINTISHLTGGLTPRYDPQGNQTAIGAGKILGAIPFGGIGEAAGAAALEGAEGLPYVGDAISKIPGIAKKALSSAAGGAASSPGLDQSPLQGAEIGAALSPALGLAANAIPLARRGLTKLLTGGSKNVTPEQFEAARAAIPDGIKAPIGELAKSSRAQNRYATSKGAVFSGADEPYSQLYDHLTEGVNNLTKAAPNSEGLNDDVYKELSNKYENAKSKTKDAYDAFSAYADKNNIKFNRGPLDKEINSSLK